MRRIRREPGCAVKMYHPDEVPTDPVLPTAQCPKVATGSATKNRRAFSGVIEGELDKGRNARRSTKTWSSTTAIGAPTTR